MSVRFNCSGNFPALKHWLITSDIGLLRGIVQAFRSFVGVLSGPVDIVFFKELIMLYISTGVVSDKYKVCSCLSTR